MRSYIKLCVVIVILAAPYFLNTPVFGLGSLTVSKVTVEESNFGSASASSVVNFFLSGAPSANVTLNFSNNGECTLNGTTSGSLTFNSGSSSTSGTITAINDEKTEGDHSCEFSFATASSDSQYNGINRTYSATIDDNDGLPTLSIVVSEDSHIKEGNLAFRNVYSIIRGEEEPMSPITVTVWTDNQCALQKKSGDGYTSQISQTVQNYSVPIIVVANDDEVAEGDHVCHVQHLISTNDTAYKDNLVDSRYITIEDNDGSLAVVTQGADIDVPPTQEPAAEQAVQQPQEFVGQATGEPIRLRDPDAVNNLFVIMTFASVVFGTVMGWWRFGRSVNAVDKP